MSNVDASAVLGAPQIAGTMVSPRGLASAVTLGVAGRLVSRETALTSFKRGFLAASATDLAIVGTKTGALRARLTDEALITVPRRHVASVHLEKGLVSKLTISFISAETDWELEVPRAFRRDAIAFVEAVDGTIS